MDLLFKRYASPFLLLDEMILSGRMLEFVEKIIKIRNEEQENETLWEYYLHRVFDKTYSAFLRDNGKGKQKPEEEIDFEATIKESESILTGFVPE